MTREEARGLAGHAVLYSSGFGEPEKVVITEATEITVEISWPDSERRARVLPGYLMPLPGEGADPLAAIQARLNDFAAAAIRATPGNSKQAEAVFCALRELNWAAGLDFEGAPPAAPRGIARVPRRDGGPPRRVAGDRTGLGKKPGRDSGEVSQARRAA